MAKELWLAHGDVTAALRGIANVHELDLDRLLTVDPIPPVAGKWRYLAHGAEGRAGIYIFSSAAGEALYVGQSANLIQRVRNHIVAIRNDRTWGHGRWFRRVKPVAAHELRCAIGLMDCAAAERLRVEAELICALAPRGNRRRERAILAAAEASALLPLLPLSEHAVLAPASAVETSPRSDA